MRVCLLLLAVWSGLDIVCTVLDKYRNRTSHAEFSLQQLLLLGETAVRKVYIQDSDTCEWCVSPLCGLCYELF